MYQSSEIVNLMLVAALTPALVIGARAMHVAGGRWFLATYVAVVSGFIFTVAEGYFAPGLLDFCEHACYAFGGICLAGATRAFMLDSRKQAGAS